MTGSYFGWNTPDDECQKSKRRQIQKHHVIEGQQSCFKSILGHSVYKNLICQFHGKIQDGGPKHDVTEIVEIENGAKIRFGK